MNRLRSSTAFAASIVSLVLISCAGGSNNKGGSSSGGGSGGASGSGSGGNSSSSTSSGQSSSSSSGSSDPLAAARAQCVSIINTDRASLTPPSPPLVEASASEEACVDAQAKADAAVNVSHSAFGQCQEAAQNECPGWPGPPSSIMTNCLAQMWAEGPPPKGQDNHWLNMSNASFTKVACGFYQTPSGEWWAAQDFW